MGMIRDWMETSNTNLMAAVSPYRTPGEEVLHAETCKQTGLFWRIFPLTPDVMIKKSIFVLTDKRILVLRLKALGKGSYPIKKEETLPLEEIKSIKPKTGMLTSSLVIKDVHNKKWLFLNLLKSTAKNVTEAIEALRAGS